MPHQIVLTTPAWIAELEPCLANSSAALVENATIACAQYDYGYGQQRPWLRPLLIVQKRRLRLE
jgi:hypothetical protein